MPLVPLLPIFHSFNREYFDGSLTVGAQPLLSLRWSDGRLRKTAGFYRRGPRVRASNGCEIVLSRPLLEHLPQSATESTLCHEMIHAWIDLILNVREGHGPHFRARMAAINSFQDNFEITISHKFPVATTPPRWLALCPSCGLRFPYRRLVRGAACRKCCEAHHGGRWDSSCLLVYESVLKEA